jgi:hypothetical protein
MTPQQVYDAAVSAANSAHQLAVTNANRDFAAVHAGQEGYEEARETHATLTGTADNERNRALAAAAYELNAASLRE